MPRHVEQRTEVPKSIDESRYSAAYRNGDAEKTFLRLELVGSRASAFPIQAVCESLRIRLVLISHASLGSQVDCCCRRCDERRDQAALKDVVKFSKYRYKIQKHIDHNLSQPSTTKTTTTATTNMLRLSKFAQLAASAKNAMTSRSAATSQENLATINESVQKLTQIVHAYAGGLLAASPISNQEAALGIHIKNATADANAAEIPSEQEAREIIAYITDVLEPSIRACMTAMKSKKELLLASSLQGTVTGDMKDLRAQTDMLGKALVAKAPASEREAGQKVLKIVDDDFEDALKHFA
ncbi:hypothetical protein CERZMDRAFT_80464 [Cercospora zeae-maydis SCOH1-5]|uniref:Uncharacterized protein n=1 Tax=Cercospora zeae-maydis SCOH1-5 TaxID=717836 RepID=A0A6A6FX23_9PEZI|nr:hypothetical protein CERZMDRAFT_80464 [Cercospora zeae-maydis SCOH1-5]